jgi:hypothetical protein
VKGVPLGMNKNDIIKQIDSEVACLMYYIRDDCITLAGEKWKLINKLLNKLKEDKDE